MSGQHFLANTRKLDRFRSEMQALSKCRNNLSSARKQLTQRGGFLPLLLAPLAAAIGKALFGAAVGAAGTAIIRKITKS